MRRIVCADNLAVLPTLRAGSVDLIYLDPPFNTGARRVQRRLRTASHADGDRTGFHGRRYASRVVSTHGYGDTYGDYAAFLEPRLRECWRVLARDGSLFLHLDWREVHRIRVRCDDLFGRDRLRNELIWAYDYGGRPRDRWPAKHDTILWYVKDPKHYTFDREASDRIPYLAPGLVGDAKARRGKLPTDVWWHTIAPTAGPERTGYPTQKPLGILRRIVAVHSKPGDLVADFFAGSGTTGEAAARLGRSYLLVDEHPVAARIMAKRLAWSRPACVGFRAPAR